MVTHPASHQLAYIDGSAVSALDLSGHRLPQSGGSRINLSPERRSAGPHTAIAWSCPYRNPVVACGLLPLSLDHAHDYHTPEQDASVELGRYSAAIDLPDIADDLELLLYLGNLLAIEFDSNVFGYEPSSWYPLPCQTSPRGLDDPADLLPIGVEEEVLILDQS